MILLALLLGILAIPFLMAYCIVRYILSLFGIGLRRREYPSNIREL